MDIRKIKKLIELLEESVRIARQTGGAHAGAAAGSAVAYVRPSPAHSPAAASAPASRAAAHAAREEAEPAATDAGEGEHVVAAPMVGTYYAAPAPGAKPFVEVGDEVQPGQVLCTIEAMKMMNQIESEYSGRVRATLVKNGEPVEFGQPLFIIE